MPKEKKSKANRRNKRYCAKSYAYLRICNDVPYSEIIAGIQEKYDYAEATARHIYEEASKQYEKNLMADSEKIRNKNMQRLEGLIDASVEDADSATLLKAIDAQNKMVGAYETRVSVKGEGEAPVFRIKVDE